MLQEPGRGLDLLGANRHGQQLFFANMAIQRRKTPRLTPEHREPEIPSGASQEALFALTPDPAVVRQRALERDAPLRWYCDQIVREHASKYGWSKRQRNDVTRSLRLLQVLQDTPGGPIRASDVQQLPMYGGNISSTLEVLAEAGLLIDDRQSQVERYFAGKTATLPEPMRQQLEVWLEVMLNGSSSYPRRRSRDPQTARIHIMGITPIIEGWAAAGHQSLAEITAEQVRAALPASGSHRNWAQYGLTSLFTVLKAKKLIFTNPSRGLRSVPVNESVPLPLDTEVIREALNSPHPHVALSVALVAFHALTDNQLRELKLTDIVDGWLTLEDRTIPLAEPVRVRLSAWLDHRGSTWPNTSNDYLLINQKTAPRLKSIGKGFWQRTSVRPQALREDRILQEIHANGGDVRQICDLFGLSVKAATRYAATLGHPDLQQNGSRVRDTQDST